MDITSERDGDAQCLRLQGELTIYSAMAVKEALVDALVDAPELVLDLQDVIEIDTSGVQLLAAAAREATDAGKRLRLSGPSAAVRGLIELYDLGAWFGDSLVLAAEPPAHEGSETWV
ncbi:lipid asymmetry maintenance protein MlaB [Acidovorax sp. ACV01]|uniref:STAS domain-containing protein n=1 Tax=Acidovorax sp. ACV01 TaxID=2769311 RepID=UPI00177B2B39|nr:STAS domain-containing protein [Acidovorax sp. ACV01]MBD9391471.1 STAS domain-containing protein [Acidovorax sp. ACV01]